ncbi:hypothetical protein ACXYRK_02160 [Mycoplasma sp. AC1221]
MKKNKYLSLFLLFSVSSITLTSCGIKNELKFDLSKELINKSIHYLNQDGQNLVRKISEHKNLNNEFKKHINSFLNSLSNYDNNKEYYNQYLSFLNQIIEIQNDTSLIKLSDTDRYIGDKNIQAFYNRSYSYNIQNELNHIISVEHSDNPNKNKIPDIYIKELSNIYSTIFDYNNPFLLSYDTKNQNNVDSALQKSFYDDNYLDTKWNFENNFSPRILNPEIFDLKTNKSQEIINYLDPINTYFPFRKILRFQINDDLKQNDYYIKIQKEKLTSGSIFISFKFVKQNKPISFNKYIQQRYAKKPLFEVNKPQSTLFIDISRYLEKNIKNKMLFYIFAYDADSKNTEEKIYDSFLKNQNIWKYQQPQKESIRIFHLENTIISSETFDFTSALVYNKNDKLKQEYYRLLSLLYNGKSALSLFENYKKYNKSNP